MLLFQFPGIAERWLTEDNWANFGTWARHPDADEVIAELESAGSLTPGLNWYRANVPPESWVEPPPQVPPVHAPTMGIWSTSDPALTEIQMTDSAKNVAGPWRYERLDGPGHWMQLDAPNQVNPPLPATPPPPPAPRPASGLAEWGLRWAPPDRDELPTGRSRRSAPSRLVRPQPFRRSAQPRQVCHGNSPVHGFESFATRADSHRTPGLIRCE